MHLLQHIAHFLCHPVVADGHDLAILSIVVNRALGLLISGNPCIRWLFGFRSVHLQPCAFPGQQHRQVERTGLGVVRQLRNQELLGNIDLSSVPRVYLFKPEL